MSNTIQVHKVSASRVISGTPRTAISIYETREGVAHFVMEEQGSLRLEREGESYILCEPSSCVICKHSGG